MGPSDFRNQKSESNQEERGPNPHYVFAHYALRQIALAEPLQFLAIAASPDAGEFISAILRDVVTQCGRDADFEAADIKVHLTRVNNYPCAVIEMPEPRETTEAYMVALLVPIDLSVEPPPDLDQVTAHYFTLEKAFSLSGESRTVLAEWGDQKHSNYGEGPEPTVEAFVAALSGQVSP